MERSQMIVIEALFCSIASLYWEIPACISFVNQLSCLVVRCLSKCEIVPIKTCCQAQLKLLCLDYRCACPCNESVPCLCTIFFLTCFPKCGWALKLHEFSSFDEDSPKNDATVFYAACCYLIACSNEDCCTCSGYDTCFCAHAELYCDLKGNEPGFRQAGHCLCVDQRCALPLDEEIPKACTPCPFFVVFPTDQIGCCKTVGDLDYEPPGYDQLLRQFPGYDDEPPVQQAIKQQPV